jgi:hypothetical protein
MTHPANRRESSGPHASCRLVQIAEDARNKAGLPGWAQYSVTANQKVMLLTP